MAPPSYQRAGPTPSAVLRHRAHMRVVAYTHGRLRRFDNASDTIEGAMQQLPLLLARRIAQLRPQPGIHDDGAALGERIVHSQRPGTVLAAPPYLLHDEKRLIMLDAPRQLNCFL